MVPGGIFTVSARLQNQSYETTRAIEQVAEGSFSPMIVVDHEAAAVQSVRHPRGISPSNLLLVYPVASLVRFRFRYFLPNHPKGLFQEFSGLLLKNPVLVEWERLVEA